MWTLLVAPAFAQVSPETRSTGAFHDDLAKAKEQLFAGEQSKALAILEDLSRRLEAGEEPPRSLAFEVLVYLGDVQFSMGDTSAARRSFRNVLTSSPEHSISPYHHGEDVRAFFALVREKIRKEIAARPPPIFVPPPQRRRLPLWGYAGFGLPQFKQRRPVAGLTYAGLQGVFAIGSVSSYVWIVTVNRDPARHPLDWTGPQVTRRVRNVRNYAQLPFTGAFYAAWFVSVVDGAGTWARTQPKEATVQLHVGPSSVRLSGTF